MARFQLRLRTIVWLAVISVICLSALPQHVNAAEQILEFFSDVQVSANGALTVEETITVKAEQRQIRRGIYRDFPVRYLDQTGLWRKVGFKLLQVTRNGSPEPYHTQQKGNFKRIYIGSKNTFINRGVHHYTIKYRTTRQLRYFKKFDEIFWNATGNFWNFPINRAIARITLPQGAHIIRKAGYTGRFGARGTDYRVTEENTLSITFEATRRLGRREGLSVAVAFPKGIVKQPSQSQLLIWRFWDNIGLIILLLGTLTTLVFYLTIWHRIGRDPQKGIIIPMFKPPEGLSPATVSYIHFWGFKSLKNTPLSFVAALISLAIKGYVKIDTVNKHIEVERLSSPQNDHHGALSPGEKSIIKKLFGIRDKITFDTASGKKIKRTLSSFSQAILREYDGNYFRNNYIYFAGGIAISVISLVTYLFLSAPTEEQIVLVFFLFAAGVVGAVFLFPGLARLFGHHPGGGSTLVGALMTAFGAAVIILIIVAPIKFNTNLSFAAPLAAGSLGIMNVAFFFLLRAPTLIGRTIMDHIEGFKLYLTTAETERMNLHDAPDMTTQLYENYLAYAIGLGVEKPWSNAFSSHMARITLSEQNYNYHPAWYSGRAFDSANLGAATSSLASSIAASTASAMPKSSSSGSGGGGYSGGGGGGGGGGGW